MSWPPKDLQEQRERYLQWWTKYGAKPEGMALSKGKQDIRFDVLLSFFELSGASILDVGCGFGDLNKAIQFFTSDYIYHGVDFMPEYLQVARDRYESPTVTFQQADFLNGPIDRTFDIGIACGPFNFRHGSLDKYDLIRRGMEKMLSLCNVGIAIDMLSDRVNFEREESNHFAPERVLEIALSLTKNVALRHDYQPFEFAIVLYKDDSYDELKTVFNRHIERKRPLVETHMLS